MDRWMYRGKRVDNGDWVQGFLFEQIYDCTRMICIGVEPLSENRFGEIYESCYHEIDSSTVSQCTGLLAGKSCRGESEDARAVFEGDILIWHDPSGSGFVDDDPMEVTWKKGVWWLVGKYDPMLLGEEDMSEWEIIGTIHDAERAGSENESDT